MNLSPTLVLVVSAALMVAGLAVAAALRARLLAGGDPAVPPDDLSFYEVALLAGGPRRVADTALAYLTWAGVLEVRETSRKLVLRTPPRPGQPLHPWEAALVNTISRDGSGPAFPLAAATDAAAAIVDAIPGLAVAPAGAAGPVAAAVGPALVAGVGAGVWMWDRTGRGLPVEFVPLVPLLAAAVILVAIRDRPRATRRGRQAVETLRSHYDDDLTVAAAGVTSLPVERAMYVVALYGRPALTGGLSALRTVLGP